MSLEKVIGARVSGQESVRIAYNIIEIWQGLTRDLILLEFGHNNLLQHLLLDEELEKIKSKFTIKSLLKLLNNLTQARQYLMANVSPKLTLENIIINI